MQLAPDMASDSADDYLKDNNYPESLSEQFNTQNIRIYERYSPLSSLHAIGRPLAEIGDDDKTGGEKVLAVLTAPIAMFLHTVHEVANYLPPYTAADAFALPIGKTCYMRPPSKEVDLADVLGRLSNISKIIDLDHFELDADQAQVEDAFRTLIMAHEMEHCEQPRSWNADNIKESDSDLMALRLLKSSGYDAAVVEEARKLFMAARITSSLGSEAVHDTGLSILRGSVSPISAHLTSAVYDVVGEIARDIVDVSEFPSGMKSAEKTYHSVRALVQSGLLDDANPEAKEYAVLYLSAYQYLNKVSGGVLVEHDNYHDHLDLGFLTVVGPSQIQNDTINLSFGMK